MRTKLTLENLINLNAGEIVGEFNRSLAEIVRDLEERPGDKTARKLELSFSIKPKLADHGVTGAADVQIEVNSKVPKRKTSPIQMRIEGDGLEFNPVSQSDVHQHTIDEVVESD